jgi:hypothetical protein
MRDEHDYRTCEDRDCERFPCRVYKEGHADGFDDGHAAGYATGYAEGYGEGFAAGARSAG